MFWLLVPNRPPVVFVVLAVPNPPALVPKPPPVFVLVPKENPPGFGCCCCWALVLNLPNAGALFAVVPNRLLVGCDVVVLFVPNKPPLAGFAPNNPPEVLFPKVFDAWFPPPKGVDVLLVCAPKGLAAVLFVCWPPNPENPKAPA